MSILEVHDVSIRYMTGDFKEIGLKEYVMRKLKGEYHVNEFWADRHITFTLKKGDCVTVFLKVCESKFMACDKNFTVQSV